MGTGYAASRSRSPSELPSASLDRWLKRVIFAVAGMAVAYFSALFLITR
jgi:hypothetical protein